MFKKRQASDGRFQARSVILQGRKRQSDDRCTRLWRHHCSTLLRSDGEFISATREDSEPAPIDVEVVEISPPSHNEVRAAIQRLKNKKTAGPRGLPVELFRSGDDELVMSMHLFMAGRKHAQQLEP